MPKLGSAYVEIKTDRRKLGPGLDKAERKVEGSAANMQRSIDKVNWAAVAAAATAAAAVIGYGMKQAIDAASDLEEVTSKFDVVFSGQRDQAEQWARQLVDGYAMSTREARQYLSSVQDLLVPMGMQAASAARLSGEVVKLSADLGSFNNVQTAQVMDDIQSALVGNYETMKKYGVVLNAAVVEQKALDDGLAKSKKQLTAAHKAQAAYNLIVQGSQAAIGDMARTSGSYANQQKQLTANVEEFKALLGNELLPMATETVKVFNNWYEINGELLVQDIAGFIDRSASAFERLADAYQKTYKIRKAIGDLIVGPALTDEAITEYISSISGKSYTGKIDKNTPGYDAYSKNPGPGRKKTTVGGDLTSKDVANLASSMEIWKDGHDWDIDGGSYAEEINKYNREIENSIELQNRMAAAIDDTYGDYGSIMDGLVDGTESATNEMRQAFMGWGNEFSSMLTDAVWGAELSFKSIAESFGKMITQMVIQKKVVEPLFNSVLSTENAHGNIYDSGGLVPFASGGVVTRPTVFPFASGIGLMGEAGPEAIMPLTRTPGGDLGVKATGGGGGIVVNHTIINNTGAQVSTQERETPQGVDIETTIGEIVADQLLQRGKAPNRAMRNEFGANTPLVRR